MKKIRFIFLCFLIFAGSASATTINFDDGIHGGSVGSYYSTYGVLFTNTNYQDNFGLPGGSGPLGIAGVGGESIVSWDINHAIEANFTISIGTVSVTGIDVGGNGIRMDAYDSSNNLLDYSEWYGVGEGIDQFTTLTIINPLISKILIYQPRQDEIILYQGQLTPEGTIIDNLVFEPTSPVPEASTILLLGVGLLGIAGVSRRKK